MLLETFAETIRMDYALEHVYVHTIPDSVNAGIYLLYDSNGATIYPDLPGYKRCNFLVVSRSENFVEGHNLADLSRKSLLRLNGYSSEGILVKTIYQLSDFVPSPRSPGGFVEWSAEFRVYFIERND